MAIKKTPVARMRRSRSGTKSRPTRRVVERVGRPVTLEEVLVAFQKSLARSSRSSLEAAQAESAFGTGDRSLYTVDTLSITLNAGFRPATSTGAPDRIEVDFDAPADQRSELQFVVEAKPLELTATARLTLANGDALGAFLPVLKVRGALIGPPSKEAEQAVPLEGREVTLHFQSEEASGEAQLNVHTNHLGQFAVDIDPSNNRLESAGRVGSLAGLDLRQVDSFFVFASCREPLTTSKPVQFAIQRGDRDEHGRERNTDR